VLESGGEKRREDGPIRDVLSAFEKKEVQTKEEKENSEGDYESIGE